MKKWWRIWLLTYWNRWICVRYFGCDSPANFTTKGYAAEHLKRGGFAYKDFRILPVGVRTSKGRKR